MPEAHALLVGAIEALYDDTPIIGDPDLLDFDIRERSDRAAS
jgi:hypothetical protein